MGWKGAIRTMGAAVRAAERDAKRRQRELDKRQQHFQKMEELERAAYEVDVFLNHIELIQSLHKECSPLVDWLSIANSSPPKDPGKLSNRESQAIIEANNYKPSFFDRLFKRQAKKQTILNNAIDFARTLDHEEHAKALEQWKKDQSDWEESNTLARQLLAGDKDSKLQVIKELNPFSEISNLGSSLSFIIHENAIVEVEIHIHGESIVPSKTKSLLQSGRLSTKDMPKSRFYEIYQDYVCSCVLRVANELFSILPDAKVLVTAVDEVLDTKSGHLAKQPILSVAVSRSTIAALNMGNIDPSDSMSNFIHKMAFKKTKGFEPVDRVAADSLDTK